MTTCFDEIAQIKQPACVAFAGVSLVTPSLELLVEDGAVTHQKIMLFHTISNPAPHTSGGDVDLAALAYLFS